MFAKKQSDAFTWGTGLWVARPLTEPEVKFILAALERWDYTTYYWLPDPNNELDWQDGARFYFKVMDCSTWTSFMEHISHIIQLEMFTWIETGPNFESGLSKHTTLFTQSNLNKFLFFTQRFTASNS
jgi:hypothetical protein